MTDHLTLEDAHVKGFALVREHTARFAAYIRELEPPEVEMAVPGTSWTVGETVVHVRTVYERYTVDRRRAATPAEVGVYNQEDVDRLDVDMEAAAASMEAQVGVLAELVDHVPPDLEFPFHAGVPITMAGGWGNLLGELLAHGDDLARATGTPFDIPSDDVEIVWRFAAPVLAGWLRPECRGLAEAWDLVFPFGSIRLEISADGLTHENEPSGDLRPGVAHRVVAIDDAAELLLMFPYRRRVITDPLTALLASRFLDL